MVEIDETELVNLRNLQRVADTISKNPKARALLQQAVEIATPDQAGPEIMLRREFNSRFDEFEKKWDEREAARSKKEQEAEDAAKLSALEARWAIGRKHTRDAGYTNEGLQALEKWMEDNGVADHRIAIPAFEKENPPPEPVNDGGSSRWDFFNSKDQENPDIKALMEGNEDRFMSAAIKQALAEARGRR